MRRLAVATVFLFVCPIALAQMFHHAMEATPDDKERSSPCTKQLDLADPQPDVDKVYWPVTGNADALPYFTRGITEYYGFNFEEALLYFRIAKEKDPSMAMASWGIALAAGPNINLGMDLRCRDLAVSAMACAYDLANVKQNRLVSPVEQGLINALWLRYAGPMSETVAYAVAMSNVWDRAKKDMSEAPADQKKRAAAVMANVGALYAEARLNMRPWGLFDAAYRPALDTDTIKLVLKDSMDAEPSSIGPNHYWIHTMEASDDPGAALKSAELLNYGMKGGHPPAVPGSGHLLHMPSHIYFLEGEYQRALQSNTDAIEIDDKQYGDACKGWYSEYTNNHKCPQLYYGHYPSHDHFFRALSASFSGQSEEAVNSACQTRSHAIRFQANEPGLQRYMTAPLMALVMNRKWDAILNESTDKETLDHCYMSPFPGNGCHIYRAMLHWARGMAYASRHSSTYEGRIEDLKRAQAEYDDMAIQMHEIDHPTPTECKNEVETGCTGCVIVHPGPTGWGNNTAAAVLSVAQSTLQARFTWERGYCKPCKACDTCDPCDSCKTSGPCNASLCAGFPCSEIDQTIEHLKLAVTHEDALVYDEPPQWFPPSREALGGAYIRAARTFGNERRLELFINADKTFDEELKRHPGSGRALYGKLRALQGRGASETEIKNVKESFCRAWKNADYMMTDEDLWPTIDGGDGGFGPITCPDLLKLPLTPSLKSCPLLPHNHTSAAGAGVDDLVHRDGGQ